MEEKRTLIETFLPVEEISEEAKIEKLGNAKPPISSMHYWWTRKPLIAARAVILGALLPSDFDINEFRNILSLGRTMRAHRYNISPEKLKELKNEYRTVWAAGPVLLDPFSGGGSIPFEALRLGIDTIANDYNPVAYLILKATLEYPQKFGSRIYKDVEKGLNWVYEETRIELEQYYPKHKEKDVAAYIWAWSVKCPVCGFDNPMVGQWWLCRNKRRKIFLVFNESNEGEGKLNFSIKEGGNPPNGNCDDGKGVCLKSGCGITISNDIIKSEIQKHQKEHLLAVVVNTRKGKEYDLPTKNDFDAISRAEERVAREFQDWLARDLIPFEDIPKDTRGSLSVSLYLKKWYQILNPRQLLLFITLEKKILEYYEQIKYMDDKEYSTAILIYLSFIFGKHIDRNCRSVYWDRTNQQISSTAGRRGIGMMWDHAEVNPFTKGSGTLKGMISNIVRGIEYATICLDNSPVPEIINKSVTQLDRRVQIIVTDPPYYDDVRYAEFSELFYVWERKVIEKAVGLGDVPKSEELSVGGWGRSPEFFNRLFKLACKSQFEMLTDDGILVMFFAHSSPKAWAFVINALQKTGFRITATWPIHTESSENPLARGNASIMSSIVIVARKRRENKFGYIEEVDDELKDHLLKRLDEFWGYGLRGADLTVASMGSSLDVITQYSDIKSYTGELNIDEILKKVQITVAHYVLNRYMNNASSLDTPTAFYLYARLSGLDGMPFDTANLIAKSMDIDLKVLDNEGLVELKTSGKAKGVKLQNYLERKIATGQAFPMTSLINAVHYMMAAYAKGGYAEVEQVISGIPYGRNELKDILEAFQSLPPGDPERQTAQQILERIGTHFPRRGQQALDQF